MTVQELGNDILKQIEIYTDGPGGEEEVIERIKDSLPEHEAYYPKDELTDKSMRFFVSEIIREKILMNYKKEIPYSTEVAVDQYKEEENIIRISAIIYPFTAPKVSPRIMYFCTKNANIKTGITQIIVAAAICPQRTCSYPIKPKIPNVIG